MIRSLSNNDNVRAITVAIEHARDSSSYAAHVESLFLREIVYLSLRRTQQKSSANSFLRASTFLLPYSYCTSQYRRVKRCISVISRDLETSTSWMRTGRMQNARDRFRSQRRDISEDNGGVASTHSAECVSPRFRIFRCWRRGREEKRREEDRECSVKMLISSLFLGAQRRSLLANKRDRLSYLAALLFSWTEAARKESRDERERGEG